MSTNHRHLGTIRRLLAASLLAASLIGATASAQTYGGNPAIGSGGGSTAAVALDWRSTVLAFLQANVPAANFNMCMWSSDFAGAALADDGPTYSFRTSGLGTNSKISTTNGGVWQISTGGGTGQTALGPLNAPTQIANYQVNVWAVYVRAKIITTPAAGTFLPLADLGGNLDVFLGIYGGASTVNLADGYTNDSTFTHVFATSQAIDVNGAFHDYLYVGDGTNLKAFYDLNATPIDSRAIQGELDAGGALMQSFIKGTTSQIVQIDKMAIFTAQP